MKRLHTEPLPKSMSALLLYIKRALSQPKVQEVVITEKGILVSREMVDEQEPVVPEGQNEVDYTFLLNHIEIEQHRFDPTEHGIYALYGATRALVEKKLITFELVVPGWPLFAAWLGVEETKQPPTHIFGIKTTYVSPLVTNERVVVLGAPPSSLFLTDVTFGMAIDLGV
jgi:hypothetical protein